MLAVPPLFCCVQPHQIQTISRYLISITGETRVPYSKLSVPTQEPTSVFLCDLASTLAKLSIHPRKLTLLHQRFDIVAILTHFFIGFNPFFKKLQIAFQML